METEMMNKKKKPTKDKNLFLIICGNPLLKLIVFLGLIPMCFFVSYLLVDIAPILTMFYRIFMYCLCICIICVYTYIVLLIGAISGGPMTNI